MPRHVWARAINYLASVRKAALDRLPICTGAASLPDVRKGCAIRCPTQSSHFMSNDQSNPRSALKALELKILQSYVFVLRANKNAQGYRTSTLERHGAREVRVIDPPQMTECDTIPFWIELFDHNTKVTADSYGGYDLEAVAIAADAFITRAKFDKP
jgi:hypothetical protein